MLFDYIYKFHRISKKKLYKAYKLFFGTLTSTPRLIIINELRKKELTVSELTKKLKLEQTVVSHHLARMKKCGFVNVNKKGKYRVYSLNEKTIKILMDIIDKHMKEYCLKIIKN